MNSNENIKLTTPDQWFTEKFPTLIEKFGNPVDIDHINKRITVKRINEDFFAAALGEDGSPKSPTVYVSVESRFYTYDPDRGIFEVESEESIVARLSRLFLECANSCNPRICDTACLEFYFRANSRLRAIVQKAKGILAVPADYFETNVEEFIPCANGMLSIKDKQLLPFNPSYRRRNKLGVNFNPQAKCPKFLEILMKNSVNEKDLDLIQQWCGLALTGVNVSQVILLLIGTAGGGKGTFVRVLCGIIGQSNVVLLRTDQLGQRFETSSYIGKTLLHGADVPPDFLNHKSASILKSLTGGDPLTVEIKNGNDRPEIDGNFNVIITGNANPKINLTGDQEAWKRRLLLAAYTKSKPNKTIVNLSEQILVEEASGVFNWMLEGLEKLIAKDFVFELSSEQSKVVDDLLLESQSPKVFVDEIIIEDAHSTLITNDCYTAYTSFCKSRGWTPLLTKEAAPLIGQAVSAKFARSQRNDIPHPQSGKPQRGWSGLRCR